MKPKNNLLLPWVEDESISLKEINKLTTYRDLWNYMGRHHPLHNPTYTIATNRPCLLPSQKNNNKMLLKTVFLSLSSFSVEFVGCAFCLCVTRVCGVEIYLFQWKLHLFVLKCLINISTRLQSFVQNKYSLVLHKRATPPPHVPYLHPLSKRSLWMYQQTSLLSNFHLVVTPPPISEGYKIYYYNTK